MVNNPPRGASTEKQVRIRVAPAERGAYERAARMSGLTLSAWLRLAAREMVARQFANAGEQVPWT